MQSKHLDKHSCPVCQMQVDSPQFSSRHLGIDYWYCSEQCKTRFTDNPGLYIGGPKEKAPKQLQRQVIKKRPIELERPLSPEAKSQLFDALNQMMGIKNISQSGRELLIEYDLLEVTAKQIADQLTSAGLQLDGSLLQRIKRTLIDIVEDTEIAALEVHQGNGGSGHYH